jgi:predicted nucleotidyltransferase
MTQNELLREIRTRLQARHGPRLRGIVLYGSEARGEASPDSDIDLLVLLEEPIDFGRDLEMNSQALYPLSLQIGRRISAKPLGAAEYRAAQCPLYRNAQAEGITV